MDQPVDIPEALLVDGLEELVEVVLFDAEALLAGSVSRARWLWGHLGIALLGTTLLMVGVGLGAGGARAAENGAA